MEKKVLPSPIRWAGSKRKMLNEMIQLFDHNKKIYIEPFLGSGVVLLNVIQFEIYDEYYVNDSNQNLINFFEMVRDEVTLLCDEIEKLVNCFNDLNDIEKKSIYYYEKREQFNKMEINLLTRCVLFWFLMKAGYNGVYRVNSKGLFNVPYGKKGKIQFNRKELINISAEIEKVHFYCNDYSDFLETINNQCNNEECFIYCDPPYIPETITTKNQVLYTKNRFSHEKFLKYLKSSTLYNNSSIMISMSKSSASKQLYNKYFLICIEIDKIIRIINPEKKLHSIEEAYFNYLR